MNVSHPTAWHGPVSGGETVAAGRWLGFALAALLCGSGTPRIRSSRSSVEPRQNPVRSVIVVMVDHSPILRRGVENSLVAELESRGVLARASHTDYSFKDLKDGFIP